MADLQPQIAQMFATCLTSVVPCFLPDCAHSVMPCVASEELSSKLAYL